ncbi:hypothetical protein ACFL4G_06160 [Thermodesulfobacteriota bacterium]
MATKILITGVISCILLLAPLALYAQETAQTEEPRFIWRTSLTEEQVTRAQAFAETEQEMTTLRVQAYPAEATKTVFLRSIDTMTR